MKDDDFSSGKEQGMILSELCAIRESIDRIERRIESFSKEVWEKIDAQTKGILTLEGQVKSLEDKVKAIESAKVWIVRLIVGSVFLAVASMVFKSNLK